MNKIMKVFKRYNNIRLVGHIDPMPENVGNLDFKDCTYKVQIKVLFFWITIKEFEFVEYTDACDCFRYCTDPYLL